LNKGSPGDAFVERNNLFILYNLHVSISFVARKTGYISSILRLETSPYSFNTSSGSRIVIFLKTDRDSEAIVRYVILAITSENPSQYSLPIIDAVDV